MAAAAAQIGACIAEAVILKKVSDPGLFVKITQFAIPIMSGITIGINVGILVMNRQIMKTAKQVIEEASKMDKQIDAHMKSLREVKGKLVEQ